MLKKAGMAFAALLLLAAAGLAQEDGHFDVSLSGEAVIGKQVTGQGTVLDQTNSAGPLISFRYRFNPKHSVVVNYGHTDDSQVFTLGLHEYRVHASISEFSGAYVFNPIQIGKFEPFLMAGIGDLNYNPGETDIDTFQAPIAALKQSQLMYLYGVGVDYRVFPHIAVRVQYRGLVSKSPDFKNPQLFTGALGQMAEPSIGVVFRF